MLKYEIIYFLERPFQTAVAIHIHKSARDGRENYDQLMKLKKGGNYCRLEG